MDSVTLAAGTRLFRMSLAREHDGMVEDCDEAAGEYTRPTTCDHMWPQFNSSHAARDAVDRCEPMAVPDLDVIRAAILRRASRTASKVLPAAPPCSHPFPGRMQRAETTAHAAEWGHRHTLPPPDLCGPYGGIRGDPWVPTEGYVKSIQKCWWGGD